MVQLLNETVRTGNLVLLESLLRHLPKTEVNRINQQEITPLHCSVWNGQHQLLCKLLEHANPDVQDGESGWSALHRALYWGDFFAASLLLKHGASLSVLDHQGRTPVDLLSHELKDHLQAGGMLNVFAWGNGANYQLGTGRTDLTATPARIDVLHNVKVVAIEAAKFHSCALTSDGQVYTWGWGRGGRLGHPEFRIHCGEGAQIEPRIVKALEKIVVKQVTAGKHHTAVVASNGDVYTWGSNKDGRLGFPQVDTQPTPRKVQLRTPATYISAGNKHTVAVTVEGHVYTWGSNRFGQLGYGTSDSGCSYNPRVVESLQGRCVSQVSASKRHTVALTVDGEVFTWGHRVVAIKRVVMHGRVDTLRSDKKSHISFHKNHEEVTKPKIAYVSAGSAHTTCLTQQGLVLAWRSWDPRFDVVQVGGLIANARVLQASSGKERTTVVTDEGDVYFWEGKSEMPPQNGQNIPAKWTVQVQRQLGVKKAVSVAVGEKHTLGLQSIWMPPLPTLLPKSTHDDEEEHVYDPDDLYTQDADKLSKKQDEQLLGSSFRSTENMFDTIGKSWEGVSYLDSSPRLQSARGPASLQLMCQVQVAKMLVDLKLCIEMLNYLDSMRADALQEYCMSVVLHNMDVIIYEYQSDFCELTQHVLEQLSEHYNAHFRFVEQAKKQEAKPAEEEEVDLSKFILEDFYERDIDPIDEVFEYQCSTLRNLVKKMSQFTTSGMRASRVIPMILPKPQSPSKLIHQGSGTSSNLSLLTQSLQAMKSGDVEDASVFMDEATAVEQEASFKLSRTLKKKLQQIQTLETRMENGERMDIQQLTKIGQKSTLEAALNALEQGMSANQVQEIVVKAQESTLDKLEKESLLGQSPKTQPLFTTMSSSKSKKGRKGKSKTNKTSTNLQALPTKEETISAKSLPAFQLPSTPVIQTQPQPQTTSQNIPLQINQVRNDQDFPALGQISSRKKDVIEKPASQKTSAKKIVGKQVKKGALSMFLAGELEEKSQPTPPQQQQPQQPTPVVQEQPKTKQPMRPPKVVQPQALSLREIQEREKRGGNINLERRSTYPMSSSSTNAQNEGPSLADFVRVQASEKRASFKSSKSVPLEKPPQSVSGSTTPSEAMGTSPKPAQPVPPPAPFLPPYRAPSLREILEEQQYDQQMMSSYTLYKGKSPSQGGLLGTSPATGSSPKVVHMTSAAGPSKWYQGDKQRVHSLAAIQVEEEAMQQLSKIYGSANVRVVNDKEKRQEVNKTPQRIKGFDVQGSSEHPSTRRSRNRR